MWLTKNMAGQCRSLQNWRAGAQAHHKKTQRVSHLPPLVVQCSGLWRGAGELLGGTWLAHSEECMALDLGFMASGLRSLTLGVEITPVALQQRRAGKELSLVVRPLVLFHCLSVKPAQR